MGVIKGQKSKAYILLESLVALAVFAIMSSFVLATIQQSRKEQAVAIYQQELLAAAKMAVQTKQDRLTINGFTVEVVRNQQEICVYHEGKELLYVAKEQD